MLRFILLAILLYLVIRMVLRFFRQKLFSGGGGPVPGPTGRRDAEEADYEVLDSRVKDDD